MILRFSIAIFIAAAWRIWCVAAAALEQGAAFYTALKTIRNKPSVSSDMATRRLAVCSACPIFHRKLMTCGSPLDHKQWPVGFGKKIEIGCFCFMPIKVKTECNCWAYDNDIADYGWPRNLNSYEKN